QLPWTHNLLILSGTKRAEEREFYLKMALRERWSKRELERQLNGALVERVVLSPANGSPPVTQTQDATGVRSNQTSRLIGPQPLLGLYILRSSSISAPSMYAESCSM